MFLNLPKKAKSVVVQWRGLVSLVRRIRVQIPPSPLVVTIEREREREITSSLKTIFKSNHQSHRSVSKVVLLRIMMFHNLLPPPPLQCFFVGGRVEWRIDGTGVLGIIGTRPCCAKDIKGEVGGGSLWGWLWHGFGVLPTATTSKRLWHYILWSITYLINFMLARWMWIDRKSIALFWPLSFISSLVILIDY